MNRQASDDRIGDLLDPLLKTLPSQDLPTGSQQPAGMIFRSGLI
jgi:hypothetical protein